MRVVEEVPTAIEGEGRVYIHDFGVLDPRGAVLELGEGADRVTDTIAAVWRGDCESDSLNRLVALSSLTWWEIRVLRALRNYRMRVSARYTENYRNDAMASYPSISERLIRMFEARFDPCGPPRRRRSTRSGRRSTATSEGSPRWTRTTSCDTCSGRSRRSCGPTPTCRIVGT